MAGGKKIEGRGTDNREREPVTKNEDSDDRITRESEAKTLYISTHAYTHVLRLSLDLPYEKR